MTVAEMRNRPGKRNLIWRFPQFQSTSPLNTASGDGKREEEGWTKREERVRETEVIGNDREQLNCIVVSGTELANFRSSMLSGRTPGMRSCEGGKSAIFSRYSADSAT